MVNSSKVVLAGVVIFLAGAATGALMAHKTNGPLPRASEASVPEMVDRLDKELELGLSSEQRTAIQKLLEGSQENIKMLLQQIEPQASAEKAQLREHILGELTKTQCDKLEKIFNVNSETTKPKLPETKPKLPEKLSEPPASAPGKGVSEPPAKNQWPPGSSHGSMPSSHQNRGEQAAEPAAPTVEKPAVGHPLSANLDNGSNSPAQSRD